MTNPPSTGPCARPAEARATELSTTYENQHVFAGPTILSGLQERKRAHCAVSGWCVVICALFGSAGLRTQKRLVQDVRNSGGHFTASIFWFWGGGNAILVTINESE